MKNLIYIANIRLPTEKAHGIQIMEMCAAFADQGVAVELVVPRRKNPITDDPFLYHDIKKNFSIRYLPCLDTVKWGRIGFLVELVTFAGSFVFYSVTKPNAIFYTRDEFIAALLRVMGKNVAWEGHTGQKNLIVKLLIFFRVRMVLITEALQDLYKTLGVELSQMIVAPDGADISRFDIPMNMFDARKQLNLPQDKKIVLYKGHLYERKGAHTLAEAAQCLGDKNILCVFIGGTEEDVISFKERFGSFDNVLILGNRPRQETPVYQKASDVLVIPNSAKDDVSKLYTSPMKLFGYMASKVPIIASDLPSLREIIDDSLVTFFTPDDSNSLCKTITHVFDQYDGAKEKAIRTFSIAENYSWQNRAKNILNFIQ